MPDPVRCEKCGTEIAPALLACPGCGALVHAHELKQLADLATRAESPVDALAHWRRALELLPAGSRQYEVIQEKVKSLAIEVDRGNFPAKRSAATAGHPSRKQAALGIIGTVLAIALTFGTKFKFLIIFLLTKGKLILLGLANAGTMLSMFASFALYWTIFGWKFAAGLVLSIYVHEMGHVYELRRFGVKASAPMFVPGLGALVLLREKLHSPIEDARVGLAGPWWGFGAALATWAWAWWMQSPLATAIAHVAAWLNLLNLMPVWQLDGSRAFRALSRRQRWIAVVILLGVFLTLQEMMVGIVLIVACVRAFGRDADPKGDPKTLVDYCFLAAALAAITHANGLPLDQLK